MPKTRPLTAELRQAELERRSNEVLALAIRRNHADTGMTDKVFVEKIGAGYSSLQRWKKHPGDMSISMARSIARACGMSREDWLAVGGYGL